MGQADDVERVEAGCRAQPHSLYKRRVAEQGGDAGGGSTLGTQSTFAQMGHIDSPGRSRLNRDIHFEKSPEASPARHELLRLAKLYKHRGRLKRVCFCAPQRCHGEVVAEA